MTRVLVDPNRGIHSWTPPSEKTKTFRTKPAEGSVPTIDLRLTDPLGRRAATIDVIDSTGAGDCFVGAFAACFAVDRNLETAVALANAAAALSVQRSGAGGSMPTRAEAIEQLSRSSPRSRI